jgi:hypothetical protein
VTDPLPGKCPSSNASCFVHPDCLCFTSCVILTFLTQITSKTLCVQLTMHTRCTTQQACMHIMATGPALQSSCTACSRDLSRVEPLLGNLQGSVGGGDAKAGSAGQPFRISRVKDLPQQHLLTCETRSAPPNLPPNTTARQQAAAAAGYTAHLVAGAARACQLRHHFSNPQPCTNCNSLHKAPQLAGWPAFWALQNRSSHCPLLGRVLCCRKWVLQFQQIGRASPAHLLPRQATRLHCF